MNYTIKESSSIKLSEMSLTVFEITEEDGRGFHNLRYMASFDNSEEAMRFIRFWVEDNPEKSFTMLPVFDVESMKI